MNLSDKYYVIEWDYKHGKVLERGSVHTSPKLYVKKGTAESILRRTHQRMNNWSERTERDYFVPGRVIEVTLKPSQT